jgi:hypothetical protein
MTEATFPDGAQAASPAGFFPTVCVYASEDGTSHLADLPLPAVGRTQGADGATQWTGLEGAKQWGVVVSDGSAYGQWHASSQVGLSIVLYGVWEIEAGSGQRRVMPAGSVLLMFDTTGQGHRSQLVSDQPCAVMGVGLDETTTARFQSLLRSSLGPDAASPRL